MRRISDGVKITERYRTTEQLEPAYLEENTYNYLCEDLSGYTFMASETYHQITVPEDIIGDQSVYLQEDMRWGGCAMVPRAPEMGCAVNLEPPLSTGAGGRQSGNLAAGCRQPARGQTLFG